METIFILIIVAIIVIYFLFREKGEAPTVVQKPIKTEVTQAPFPPRNIEQVFHPLHYVPKRLMTRSEEYFFKQLNFIPKEKYFIFPQVHLSSLMQPDYHPESFEWKRENNRINRKSLDFVVFRKTEMEPVLAIELDDYTHRWYRRMERDKFIDACMAQVNIPILHIYSASIDSNSVKLISSYCK